MFNNNNNRKIAEEELEKRRKQSRTYTEPLPSDNPEITAFLKEFYSKHVFERALEFKDELEKYSDTVGEHYNFLVPEQVSFDQFFSRYYYRCNLDHLMNEVQQVQNEECGRRRPLGRTRSSDGIPLMTTLGRGTSGDGLQAMASNLLSLAGGGPSLSLSNEPKRMSRKPSTRTGARSPNNSLISDNKEKESSLSVSYREAREEMALKLLEEARGKRLD